MRAFAVTADDAPAAFVDLPEPEPGDDRIVVRVRAASLNGFDLFQASGRLTSMMPHDLPAVVGRDFAGTVEAVGAGWADVEVGDEVLGFVPSVPPLKVGSFGELVGGSSLVIAGKPLELSFEDAAAIPLAGSTALAAVEAVLIQPGDVVVIVGATGGVGTFAVQLAAQRGATVVATARAGDEATLVTSLGATETIEYGGDDVAAQVRSRYPDGVAALIDLVNRGDDFSRMAEVVRDGGRVATTLGAADPDALATRRIEGTNVRGMPTPEILASLADDAAAGRLRVVVQASFPLSEVEAAIQAFAGGTRGKLVLTI
jgi:NADPH:quinone reductase-like Zn-dependent oxidoreductase